jgi:hypothetical protein
LSARPGRNHRKQRKAGGREQQSWARDQVELLSVDRL